MSETTNEMYSAISGSDIHAVFGNYKFGSIQMIKYGVQREKAFIYTMGSPVARATARGKRSVSGAFIFTMIDRLGLVKAMGSKDSRSIFLSNDELANYVDGVNKPIPAKLEGNLRAAIDAGGSLGRGGLVPGGAAFEPYSEASIFQPKNFGQECQALLSDQLLPFDITIVGVPEYGAKFAKRLIIQGVEIMTEASGSSIDDLVLEKQQAFIAKNIQDWTPLTSLEGETGTTQGSKNPVSWS